MDQIVTCSLWRTQTEAGGYALKEGADCREETIEKQVFWQKPWPWREDPQCRSPFLRDCILWKGTMLAQSLDSCCLEEGPKLERFMKNCCTLWKEIHAGAEEESEKEGVAEMTCDELTSGPIACPSAPLWGRR